MSDDWCVAAGDGVLLRLAVQPGARRSEVAGRHGDRLKVRIAAPPVDGRANEALAEFLAEALGIAGSRIELVRGATGRRKDVRVAGMDAATARARLVP